MNLLLLIIWIALRKLLKLALLALSKLNSFLTTKKRTWIILSRFFFYKEYLSALQYRM